MAFRIEPVDRPEDFVDFEIQGKDGKVVEFKLQKNDCLPPATVKKINDLIAAQDNNTNVMEFQREMLKIVAPDYKKVFEPLASRQLDQIIEHWNKASEGDLGESNASTD